MSYLCLICPTLHPPPVPRGWQLCVWCGCVPLCESWASVSIVYLCCMVQWLLTLRWQARYCRAWPNTAGRLASIWPRFVPNETILLLLLFFFFKINLVIFKLFQQVYIYIYFIHTHIYIHTHTCCHVDLTVQCIDASKKLCTIHNIITCTLSYTQICIKIESSNQLTTSYVMIYAY